MGAEFYILAWNAGSGVRILASHLLSFQIWINTIVVVVLFRAMIYFLRTQSQVGCAQLTFFNALPSSACDSLQQILVPF